MAVALFFSWGLAGPGGIAYADGSHLEDIHMPHPTCPTCHGSGVLPGSVAPPRQPWGIQCEDCQGTGSAVRRGNTYPRRRLGLDPAQGMGAGLHECGERVGVPRSGHRE